MSASPQLRIALDLMAEGFAEAGDVPLPSRADRHHLETKMRRRAPDLPSLYALPALEGHGEPFALYGWPMHGGSRMNVVDLYPALLGFGLVAGGWIPLYLWLLARRRARREAGP
jgi:hypothetical protein